MLSRRGWLASALAWAALPGAARARHVGSGLPFPLFDAHLHLRSEDLLRYPHIAPVGAAGGPATAGAEPVEVPEVVRVLRWMDQNGVETAAALQHQASYGFDNRYLLDSIDQYRHRLMAVVALDAQDAATPATLRKLAGEHGIAGLRVLGEGTQGELAWLESPAAQLTWAAANADGLVLDIMTLPPSAAATLLEAYARLARRYPRLRLVLDHCAWPAATGAPDFGLMPAHRALLVEPNIFFKFTTANLDRLVAAGISPRDALRRYVSALGAHRLLWGSNLGHATAPYAELVGRIVAASGSLSRRDRRQVLYETARSVFVAGGVR